MKFKLALLKKVEKYSKLKKLLKTNFTQKCENRRNLICFNEYVNFLKNTKCVQLFTLKLRTKKKKKNVFFVLEKHRLLKNLYNDKEAHTKSLLFFFDFFKRIKTQRNKAKQFHIFLESSVYPRIRPEYQEYDYRVHTIRNARRLFHDFPNVTHVDCRSEALKDLCHAFKLSPSEQDTLLRDQDLVREICQHDIDIWETLFKKQNLKKPRFETCMPRLKEKDYTSVLELSHDCLMLGNYLVDTYTTAVMKEVMEKDEREGNDFIYLVYMGKLHVDKITYQFERS